MGSTSVVTGVASSCHLQGQRLCLRRCNRAQVIEDEGWHLIGKVHHHQSVCEQEDCSARVRSHDSEQAVRMVLPAVDRFAEHHMGDALRPCHQADVERLLQVHNGMLCRQVRWSWEIIFNKEKGGKNGMVFMGRRQRRSGRSYQGRDWPIYGQEWSNKGRHQ